MSLSYSQKWYVVSLLQVWSITPFLNSWQHFSEVQSLEFFICRFGKKAFCIGNGATFYSEKEITRKAVSKHYRYVFQQYGK